ncbi:MAG TPA: hypothetical protein VNC85_06175 [Mycobacteriales bacterium]|nr:hypothetical protein [Mycobacteriales bacterium]
MGEPTGMPVGPGRKVPPPAEDGTGIGFDEGELVGALLDAPAVGWSVEPEPGWTVAFPQAASSRAAPATTRADRARNRTVTMCRGTYHAGSWFPSTGERLAPAVRSPL